MTPAHPGYPDVRFDSLGFAKQDAVDRCAKAGNAAMNDPTIPYDGPFAVVDRACATQIIFGGYDNTKVAQPKFVETVIAAARTEPALADVVNKLYPPS